MEKLKYLCQIGSAPPGNFKIDILSEGIAYVGYVDLFRLYLVIFVVVYALFDANNFVLVFSMLYFVSWFVYVIVIVIAIVIAILPLPSPCIAIAIAIVTVINIILFLFIIFVCQTLDCAKHENRPVRDGQTRGQVDDYTDDPQWRPVGA